MLYAGLDYHLRTSSLCILNEDGKTIKQQTIKGRFGEVVDELAKLKDKEPLEVVFEATGGYGPLHQKLSTVARRVVMAHPAELALIWKSKRKNDRVDAQKLAKLLYLDAVPEAHVPGPEVRQWRRLIELRRSLVHRRAALKNQVHALLRTSGIAAPAPLFSKKGMSWLSEQQLDEASALERTVLIEQMRNIKAQLKAVERALGKTSNAQPRVTLLMTIPGVGRRTAEAFVAYVDRIDRFSRSGKVGSYFGLVPCQDSSAGKERLGHITKQGPPAMRQLLTEAAWMSIRTSPTLRKRFERMCHNDPGRRKIAIVALSRHLSQVMAAVLRDNQPWREKTPATP